MLKVKREIEIEACEICGKEIGMGVIPFKIADADDNQYWFHEGCVNELLIETAKKTENRAKVN